MVLYRWYSQTFSDTVLYFRGDRVQKNGGFAGILITVDLNRKRAAPKVKKTSVPKTYMDLWTEVLALHGRLHTRKYNMSAIRYSGALRIRIAYRETVETNWQGDYRCYITCPTNKAQKAITIYVKPPTFENGRARDSSESFDIIAGASLSFADNEGWPASEYGASDNLGWEVSRKPLSHT